MRDSLSVKAFTIAKDFMQSTTNPVIWTTYDLQIFEGDRVNRHEIIDGELFVTRAPDWKHQAVCINIGTVLKLWSDESDLGQPAITPGIIFSESNKHLPVSPFENFCLTLRSLAT